MEWLEIQKEKDILRPEHDFSVKWKNYIPLPDGDSTIWEDIVL